jgi:hypothetical protein
VSGLCTRLCTLHCTLHSPNPLASRSSLQPPPPPFPLSASTHTFVACFHALSPCRSPLPVRASQITRRCKRQTRPWLCLLLPCVWVHTPYTTSNVLATPCPCSQDQGKSPKIAHIRAFLAPIPSRQISPNSVHITDKCCVVGGLQPRVRPGATNGVAANYPSMCIPLTIEDVAPSSVLPEAIAKRVVEIEPRIPGFSVQPARILWKSFYCCPRRCWQNLQGTLHQQLHPGLRVPRYKLTETRRGEALCREGLDEEFNEQTKSAKFES